MIRLDKYLSDAGLGTRSELKKLIRQKQVRVNGEIAQSPDLKIDEGTAVVTLRDARVGYHKYYYYLLHKPAGCVTANEDKLHKTVMDYLPSPLPKGLSPVGRLDLDTEGLLLITNDGQLSHHLLSPTHHIPKTYYVVTDKEIPAEAVNLFKTGVDIGDEELTLPAQLELLQEQGKYSANLTIHEGRFHQVKRMFETLGCTVIYLKRISMGSLTLGDLEAGSFRELSDEEVVSLKNN